MATLNEDYDEILNSIERTGQIKRENLQLEERVCLFLNNLSAQPIFNLCMILIKLTDWTWSFEQDGRKDQTSATRPIFDSEREHKNRRTTEIATALKFCDKLYAKPLHELNSDQFL